MTDLQREYIGFLSTPTLWGVSEVCGLEQYNPEYSETTFNDSIEENLMLGKRMERFFEFQIKANDNTSILHKNVQISKNGITMGELDFIIQDHIQRHVELVYKFYLYDDTHGSSELEHWIGPNKKDTFIDKLNKLKNKQLPLLHLPETSLQLPTLSMQQIKQQVCFKGQLFIPSDMANYTFSHINKDCIVGYWYNFQEFLENQSIKSKYFIPKKQQWVVKPFEQIHWLSKDKIIPQIQQQHEQNKSPMVWIKLPNGTINKCFCVFW